MIVETRKSQCESQRGGDCRAVFRSVYPAKLGYCRAEAERVEWALETRDAAAAASERYGNTSAPKRDRASKQASKPTTQTSAFKAAKATSIGTSF